MSYKLEYITKLFQKTSRKAIENYVLTRLWHRLDNDLIKIVPQQYVKRHEYKYALTDVFFPQIKLHVEVNEPAHYLSEERILADYQRKLEIESHPGFKVHEIDCRKSLTEIHDDIEKIIVEIRRAIAEQEKNNIFRPWNMDEERDPEFWKMKNIISTKEETSLSNIEDICKLFDADFSKIKRGYLRGCSFKHPKNNQILIWCPSEKPRRGWINSLDTETESITETHSVEEEKRSHFESHKNTNQIRYVFYLDTDILGLKNYKFKGVYEYDTVNSHVSIGTVWKKIGESIILDKNQYS